MITVRPADLALAMRTITTLKTGQARQTRQAIGARQADIAQVLGVTRQAVSQWEAGVRRPSVQHALDYARIMATTGETISRMTLVIVLIVWLALSLLAAAAWAVVVPWIKHRGS